jgi:hypothetical protein
LFPISFYFGFINHGSKHEANAEIHWSSLPYHKPEWLNSTLDDIKGHGNTRLLLDIVATKNIARGDEILLYYREAWERKWEQHNAKWKSSSKNFTDILGVLSTADFNSIQKDEVIMTVAEREEDEVPLPNHIDTTCGFVLPGDMDKNKVYDVLQSNDPNFFLVKFLTLDDIKRHGNTRLLLDIVAIKDIAHGDEILLYYGEAWERKWEQHIAKWKPSSKKLYRYS